MENHLKENCRYAMLVPTSMGLRLCPDNGQPVHSSDLFRLQATSAETNVASISSFLGRSMSLTAGSAPAAHESGMIVLERLVGL